MARGTVDEVIERTVRNSRKTREQLADELALGYSNFARMTNPSDEQVRFPLQFAIPLMTATGDYSILHHMAARTEHLCVRISKLKVPKSKAGESELKETMHDTFLKALKELAEFFKNRTPEAKDRAVHAIDEHLSEVVAARRKIVRWHQPDLF